MALNFGSLALLALQFCLAVYGMVLLRRPRQRLAGGALVLLAVALLALQIVLSTVPFGIGEPLIRVDFWQLLQQTGLILAALAVAAGLVAASARWLAPRVARSRRPGLATAGLLLLLPLAAGGAMYGMARAGVPERERERDPNKRQIELQSGFEWTIYAQGTIDNPTTIAFGDDGKLYIADIAGTLWVASDGDANNAIESISRWADGFDLLVGLVWHEGELYAASSGKIEALRDTDGDGVADERRLVVDGLPSLVFRPHSNNGLAFGRDGRLYFGVGSTTNGQVEQNPLAAAILSVKPDGSDLQVYARGLGNSFDVAFNRDGELFAGDNGPSAVDGVEPPDEFNHIIKDEHYGFPYFFGDPPSDGGTRGALVSFPPHSVPTGVTFYTGNAYPPEFTDSAFITLWQRGEIQRIEVARTATGNYLSRTSEFARGFLYPIDVVTGPDGNLYIADFGTSAIYRITYDVNKAGS